MTRDILPMTKDTAEDLEFRDTKVDYLKIATGGKMPTDPEDPAWLRRYDVGTVFTAKRRGDYILSMFVIDDRPTPKEYDLLAENVGLMRVDPVKFSQAWDLFEIRQTSEETLTKARLLQKQEETENSDGTGNGAV